MNAIEEAKKLVDELYEFRNNYFIIHELKPGEAIKKESDVKDKCKITLTQLDQLESSCEKQDRAMFYMLKGRALNVVSDFDQTALELLNKAVKFNPQLTPAWNELGECYWKKNDLKAALNCFEGALKHDKRDKIALRNISMVLRQVGDNELEQRNNLVKSLEKAKEAVAVDMEDGISWYILGNAYLTMFFRSSNHDSLLLKSCKAAYNKAKKDAVAFSHSEFLFNYANVLQFEENYQETIECLSRASLLSPDWDEVCEKKKVMLNYLRDTNDMISKTASLKPRRIQSLLNSLNNDLKSFEPSKEHKLISINELSCGTNIGVNLYCKVFGCINVEKALSHTFCVLDTESHCAALIVYNLSAIKGLKLGDTISIINPIVSQVDVMHESVNYKYKSIRIDNPMTLNVNGRMLTSEYVCRPKIDNSLMND